MDNSILTKNIIVTTKKVKNICLDSDTANTDRPIISNSNTLERNVNCANQSLDNNVECSNAFQAVHNHRLQNPKNILMGHLNVNSVRNKSIEELMQNKVDICFLSETKLDETFPSQQFKINNYKLFRRDRDKHGGV